MLDQQLVKRLQMIVDRLNLAAASIDDKLMNDVAEEVTACANNISLIILRNANEKIIKTNLDNQIRNA